MSKSRGILALVMGKEKPDGMRKEEEVDHEEGRKEALTDAAGAIMDAVKSEDQESLVSALGDFIDNHLG